MKSSVDALERKVKKHIEYLKAVAKSNATKKQGKKVKLAAKYKPQFDDACSVAFGQKTGTHYQSARIQLHHQKRKLHKMTCQLKHLKLKRLHVNLGNKETIYRRDAGRRDAETRRVATSRVRGGSPKGSKTPISISCLISVGVQSPSEISPRPRVP